MMILPLPPFLLDLLFTFKYCAVHHGSLVSMYTNEGLDFAASLPFCCSHAAVGCRSMCFHRVVLMEGHTGPDAAVK